MGSGDHVYHLPDYGHIHPAGTRPLSRAWRRRPSSRTRLSATTRRR